MKNNHINRWHTVSRGCPRKINAVLSIWHLFTKVCCQLNLASLNPLLNSVDHFNSQRIVGNAEKLLESQVPPERGRSLLSLFLATVNSENSHITAYPQCYHLHNLYFGEPNY